MANQEDAYYNLGNALYRTGQKTEQTDPQQTLQKWTQAVKAYETALQLRADDADSKYNRDLVKRKIDALQQKQNQQRIRGKIRVLVSSRTRAGTGSAAIASAAERRRLERRSAAALTAGQPPPPAPAAGEPAAQGAGADHAPGDDARAADSGVFRVR